MKKTDFLARSADSILFLGRDRNNRELWLNKSEVTTHMFVSGSTGSGKTEFLLNLLTNSMLWGTGAIVVDGKGDISFFSKLHAIATATGRSDDLLLLNFSMAEVQAHEGITSHTCNPFAILSADELSQLLAGMISTTRAEDNMWRERSIGLMTTVVQALVWLRNNKEQPLTVSRIVEALPLAAFRKLYDRLTAMPEVPAMITNQMLTYLQLLPGYKMSLQEQAATAYEQHNYLTMQWTRPLGLLAQGFGHILDVETPDIDIRDVVLNQRILTIMLPSLEKSSSDIENIGKLMIGMVKAMMAQALRNPVQGEWSDVIRKRLSNSRYPFLFIMDEVGQYLTSGMDNMAQQARSLDFGLIFATQDFDSLMLTNPKVTKAILANTNTKILMKSEYPDGPVARTVTGFFQDFMHDRFGKMGILHATRKNAISDKINYGSGNRTEEYKKIEEINKILVAGAERNTKDRIETLLKGFEAGDMIVTHGNRFTIGKSGYVRLIDDNRSYQVNLVPLAHIPNYDQPQRERDRIRQLSASIVKRSRSEIDAVDQDQMSATWLTHPYNAVLGAPVHNLRWMPKDGPPDHHYFAKLGLNTYRYMLTDFNKALGLSMETFLRHEISGPITRATNLLDDKYEKKLANNRKEPKSADMSNDYIFLIASHTSGQEQQDRG